VRLQYKETGEKSTIAIFLDNSRKTQVKALHCVVCGYVAMQYYDDIKMLVPGEGPREPDGKPITTVQCSNNQCKTRYDIYK